MPMTVRFQPEIMPCSVGAEMGKSTADIAYADPKTYVELYPIYDENNKRVN